MHIGVPAVLATELLLSGVFQLGLKHVYPPIEFELATLFLVWTVLFGLGVGKFYPDGALDNRRYLLYKAVKSVVCIAVAVLLMLHVSDQSMRLELLIRFAAFYMVQLGLETWEMTDYPKRQNTPREH